MNRAQAEDADLTINRLVGIPDWEEGAYGWAVKDVGKNEELPKFYTEWKVGDVLQVRFHNRRIIVLLRARSWVALKRFREQKPWLPFLKINARRGEAPPTQMIIAVDKFNTERHCQLWHGIVPETEKVSIAAKKASP